ncbi:MAG: class I SAM-dependent DNA methyltransferase, partial [Planctomycetaceae bacterium]|nr:class I SAM-dependent DNA methyltransferase [Planctomycetaceae bacterium]
VPEEWPPFLIVCDVGHCFDLYADFTQSGKNYVPFPDPQHYRLKLEQLADPEVQQTLRAIWQDPHSLDPSRRSARVTRELADRLAKLAKQLEGQHSPQDVAGFLMRCLFTMFAEDVEVGGFPKDSFTRFLQDCSGNVEHFVPMLEDLWQKMDAGGFSSGIRAHLKRFNGGLFEDQTALPLNADQLQLLTEAAEAQWQEVEPAIFGTLLERALDPVERHKLGAHYTPRAYVERLVMPTLIEPLREQWDAVRATAASLAEDGKLKEARQAVRQFHRQLCETRVLDPACGSGNFLYVALELMKRLEGEVLLRLKELGDRQTVLIAVDPHQFLGLEVNPRAAAIADLVLWIGYLQWHFRSRGNEPLNEPIIRKFHNIECRDAVLAWDAIEPVLDEAGQPVTRWDGRTTKPHPVTGEEVPDETARAEEVRYLNPRQADWPAADYIVSNPPFVGNKRMRFALGSHYVDALRSAFPDVPESVDYVMYWWHRAAELTSLRSCIRCGFITTNSITQTYSRRVIDRWLSPGRVHLAYAVPDHPWVDTALGAAVRISMTTLASGADSGVCAIVLREQTTGDEAAQIELKSKTGAINSQLRTGVSLTETHPLAANDGLCWQGCKLVGKHFKIDETQRERMLENEDGATNFVRAYWTGSDLTKTRQPRYVIDFYPHQLEEATHAAPGLVQHLINYVLPERQQNRDKTFREKWWLFGRPRPELRTANTGLQRYIVTSEVSKHRTFQFLAWPENLVDGSVTSIASADADVLAVLSSRISVVWAMATGGRLEDRPRYQNGPCFDPFPFPDPDEATRDRIRELGEQLDAHRKRQQAQHPKLTMTGMYNVLEKLRSGEELTAKERTIHEQGLVSVLKQIHDDLDAAVAAAYGWPADLTDEQILERLVELNHQRAAEEQQGHIRWLRPEFQNPSGETQQQMPGTAADQPAAGKAKAGKAKPATAKIAKQPWPETTEARFLALRDVVEHSPVPLSGDEAARHFTRARKAAVAEMLETLVSLGILRLTDDDRYAA